MDRALCELNEGLTGRVWELLQYLHPFHHELKDSVFEWDLSLRNLGFLSSD